MKIYAPVKDFDGLRNTVRFVRGVGETENPRIIEWFLNHGYRVEPEQVDTLGYIVEVDAVETPNLDEIRANTTKVVVEPDFDNMTPNELREWMRENGYGPKIKNTRDKEKLLKILRG